MSEFAQAIPVILNHEGGYVNDASDPGGETKYGISKRTYPQLDIRNLTEDHAAAIYEKDWWDKYGYAAILSQAVATKIFDMAVNMGAKRAHKILQACVGTVADGVLGPTSFACVNQMAEAVLLPRLREACANYYQSLAQSKPSLLKFLNGWLRRAAS